MNDDSEFWFEENMRDEYHIIEKPGFNYKGDYSNSKMHGFGELYDREVETGHGGFDYKGEFSNDYFHGKGHLTLYPGVDSANTRLDDIRYLLKKLKAGFYFPLGMEFRTMRINAFLGFFDEKIQNNIFLDFAGLGDVFYEGNFSNDRFHYQGSLHGCIGEISFILSGEYQNDELEGDGRLEMYLNSKKEMILNYRGAFHQSLFHGKGKLDVTFQNFKLPKDFNDGFLLRKNLPINIKPVSYTYEGEFKEGVFHGDGSLSITSADQRDSKTFVIKGDFNRGRFCGDRNDID